MEYKIGNIRLESPFVLGPMAGITAAVDADGIGS